MWSPNPDAHAVDWLWWPARRVYRVRHFFGDVRSWRRSDLAGSNHSFDSVRIRPPLDNQETADMVTRLGRVGVAAVVDHVNSDHVLLLADRIRTTTATSMCSSTTFGRRAAKRCLVAMEYPRCDRTTWQKACAF
jgi:hypothetical protein